MAVVRSRGLPACEIPCSRSILPLFHGLGARPAKAESWRWLSKRRKNALNQSTVANSAPIPLSFIGSAAAATPAAPTFVSGRNSASPAQATDQNPLHHGL